MHRRPGEKRDNWLLIKQHDDAAREPRDKDILEEKPLSVKTGRTLDEIAAGTSASKTRRQAKPRARRKRKAGATRPSTDERATRASKRSRATRRPPRCS